MQVAIARLRPKRRCCIPRRPHPDLAYFFGRYERTDCERTDCERNDDAEPETADLDHPFWPPRRH
jgi:hypothetical protein